MAHGENAGIVQRVVEQIATNDPGAKNARSSMSLQGLVASTAAVAAALIAPHIGVEPGFLETGIIAVVSAVSFLWGLIGVLRRSDIKV
jgi:hypothetical protein